MHRSSRFVHLNDSHFEAECLIRSGQVPLGRRWADGASV